MNNPATDLPGWGEMPKRYFPDTTLTVNSLEVFEGTLVYRNKCYGNWDVCFIAAEYCNRS